MNFCRINAFLTLNHALREPCMHAFVGRVILETYWIDYPVCLPSTVHSCYRWAPRGHVGPLFLLVDYCGRSSSTCLCVNSLWLDMPWSSSWH